MNTCRYRSTKEVDDRILRKCTGLKSLKFIKKLGEGSFGVVNLYECEDNHGFYNAAIKIANYTPEAEEETEFGNIMSDCEVGPNIYKSFKIRTDDSEKLIIMMEPFQIDVWEYLTNIKKYTKPAVRLKNATISMVTLLGKMLECGLKCWDIKAENYVVNIKEAKIRMIDFGTNFCINRDMGTSYLNGLYLLMVIQILFQIMNLFFYNPNILLIILPVFMSIRIFKNRNDSRYLDSMIEVFDTQLQVERGVKRQFIHYFNMNLEGSNISNEIDSRELARLTLENVNYLMTRNGTLLAFGREALKTSSMTSELVTQRDGLWKVKIKVQPVSGIKAKIETQGFKTKETLKFLENYNKYKFWFYSELIVPSKSRVNNIAIKPSLKFGRSSGLSKKVGIKSFKKLKCPKDPYDFETYVINCRVHSKRLKTFHKFAKKAGLTIEREECVNGKAYTNELLVKMINNGIVSPKADLSPIEVAICLSHYNCWVRFIETGCSPYGLILEDDAQLKPGFVKTINGLLTGLEERNKYFGIFIIHPGNWMQTKSLQKRVATINGIKINQETVPHNPSGTAYILTRPFAKYLIKNMFPIQLPLDIYLGDNFIKKFPHFTLIPIRDPKAEGCWTAKLLNVGCGGDEGSTQDYEVDSIKTIFKKSKKPRKRRSRRRSN